MGTGTGTGTNFRTRTRGKTRAKPAGIPVPAIFTTWDIELLVNLCIVICLLQFFWTSLYPMPNHQSKLSFWSVSLSTLSLQNLVFLALKILGIGHVQCASIYSGGHAQQCVTISKFLLIALAPFGCGVPFVFLLSSVWRLSGYDLDWHRSSDYFWTPGLGPHCY
jgi:hypothetical protein